MIFRAMQSTDVDAVERLEKAIFGSGWQEGAFHNELAHNPTAAYLVVEDPALGLVGYAGFWLVEDEAHVTSVALHPECRGRQLGKRLMHQLVELAVQRGARWMTLEVRSDNEVAQRLYRRFGFARVGLRPKYYLDGCDGWIMWAGDLTSSSYQARLKELEVAVG